MLVAGIDAHTTFVMIVVVDSSGNVVHGPTRIRNHETDRLVRLLDEHKPVEVVVETSPSWPWIFDLLERPGIHVVLAHAKRLRAIADSTYKRDEVDAELLARMHLARLIPEAHIKSIEQREQATLIRNRVGLVRLRTAATCRIHAHLHNVGLSINRGHLLTRDGRRWLRSRAWPLFGPEQRLSIRMQLYLVTHLSSMIRALDKRIEQMGKDIPVVVLLKTIPGIGPYRALLIATETMPIKRFPSPAHLVSYAGLAPCSSQSGKRPVRHGSIPAGANRWLRGAFVRAVTCHVQHAPQSWLSLTYEQTRERLGWQVARVATARRLARAVHAMLRTGEVWRDNPTER